jgi:hypothetical protein
MVRRLSILAIIALTVAAVWWVAVRRNHPAIRECLPPGTTMSHDVIEGLLRREGGPSVVLRQHRVLRWNAEAGKGDELFIEAIVEVEIQEPSTRRWLLLYLHGSKAHWERPLVHDSQQFEWAKTFELRPQNEDVDSFAKKTLWGLTGATASTGKCD